MTIKLSITLLEILSTLFDHVMTHNSFEYNSLKLKTIITINNHMHLKNSKFW